ncbi:hypothetical protein OROHE_026274 [Orobanche hederae]
MGQLLSQRDVPRSGIIQEQRQVPISECTPLDVSFALPATDGPVPPSASVVDLIFPNLPNCSACDVAECHGFCDLPLHDSAIFRIL